jgi:hypothetical protein
VTASAGPGPARPPGPHTPRRPIPPRAPSAKPIPLQRRVEEVFVGEAAPDLMKVARHAGVEPGDPTWGLIVELDTFRGEMRQHAERMVRFSDQVKSIVAAFHQTSAAASKNFENDVAKLLHLVEEEHDAASNDRREFTAHIGKLVRGVDEKSRLVEQSREEIPVRLRAILADHVGDLRRQFQGAEAITFVAAEAVARQAALDELRTWRETDLALSRSRPNAQLVSVIILVAVLIGFVLGITVRHLS